MIDQKVQNRAAGRDAKTIPDRTVGKYRLSCRELADHRKSGVIDTLRAQELDAWKRALFEKGALSSLHDHVRRHDIGF
ncbi:hypothetical protein RXV88_19635 [Aestuariicoccus sp. MJ-SS9]|nr:hypothetical protein [Aestuariicoccus sp. MJ-SS9]